jgi:hypothetical protein
MTRMESGDADSTTAMRPLKLTRFSAVVGLNPNPRISTVVPGAPMDGESKKIPIFPSCEGCAIA